MARPVKNNADYFSHDADASNSRTLTILFNHFGHDGISAWWQLLELITGSENHVIDTRNTDNVEFLAAKMHFKPDRLMEILNKMSDLDAIDSELFHAGLIWCQNLVDRLAPVYKKRGLPIPLKPSIAVTEKPISETETKLSVPGSTQSKVKESKEKNKEIYKEKDLIPYQEIINLFNEISKSLPGVKTLTEARRKRIKSRWQKSDLTLVGLREIFQKVEDSDFLSGRSGKWTSCNFDWIFHSEDHLTRILEGTYDNRSDNNGSSKGKLPQRLVTPEERDRQRGVDLSS